MDDTKIGILFDLMKHPDKLEALANALTNVDTCQIWEEEAIFKAADVIIGLSQISKTNVSDIFSNFGGALH